MWQSYTSSIPIVLVVVEIILVLHLLHKLNLVYVEKQYKVKSGKAEYKF